MLQAQKELEWTLFNPGFLADYFLPETKTYMSPVPELFPVDNRKWCAHVRGTGDQPQSWTCAREVGKAVVELCKADRYTWVGWDVWKIGFLSYANAFNRSHTHMWQANGAPSIKLSRSWRHFTVYLFTSLLCSHFGTISGAQSVFFSMEVAI